jgi:hypothetical protein
MKPSDRISITPLGLQLLAKPRRLTPATENDVALVDLAAANLRETLRLLKKAGAVKSAARVRLALSSIKGAQRNVRHRYLRSSGRSA